MTAPTPTRHRPPVTRRMAGGRGSSEARLWPWVLTALVAAGALFPRFPLRSPVTMEAMEGVGLSFPPGYLALAPVFNVLDQLTILTLSQHIAVLLTLVGVFALWRLLRERTPRSLPARAGVEVGAALLSLGGLLAFYAAGALIPRPMAALVVDDPDILVIDLHSHTHSSHDGRPGFSAERRREWNHSAGFHAVLVTDHYNWGGFQEGEPRNPERAGFGTVLLQGAELKLFGKHTNVIGDSLRYRPFLDETGRNLRPLELEAAVRSGAVPPPTFLMALPVDLSDFQGFGPDAPLGLVGIEINDASPKGMEQSLRDRAEILAIADSLDLALFAGSNNHGWGRTSSAWNLMDIPGWREMTPRELEERVEAIFHAERREAVEVVERSLPYHDGSRVHLALTGPILTWNLFATLSWGERASWLLWIWGLVLLPRLRRRDGADLPIPG